MNQFRFLYKEKKWRKLVEKDVLEREGVFAKKNPIKIFAIIAIAVAIVLSLTACRIKIKKTIIFVNFKKHSFSSTFRKRTDIQFAENSIRRILDGSSLIELDAVYHLVHDVKISRPIKKFMLSILMQWLDITILKSNAVFLVHEDFYGKSSILTTLSNMSSLSVVGIQHGIMTPEYLSNSKTYPGIRTKLEYVINKEYKEMMENKKKYGSQVLVGGDAIFQNPRRNTSDNSKRITFVSSCDLGKKNTDCLLNEIKTVSDLADYKVSVRPHPAECNTAISNDISIDKRPKSVIFETPTDNEIFIGYYSTLLYEVSVMGYKTIWLTNNENESRIKVLNLKNSFIMNDQSLTRDMIHNFFIGPIGVCVELDLRLKDVLLEDICRKAKKEREI